MKAGLRGAVLPAMLAARSLGLLHADCTALVELWLARWLGGAELAAPRRPGQPMFGGYSSGVLRVGRRLGQGLQSLLAFTVANMTNDGNEVNDDQIGPQIQAKHHAAAQNNNQPVVCEPDGSPARELFTVLHRVHVGHSWYTDRQLFNVHAFSMVFSWISAQLEQREKTPLTLPKRAAGQDGRTQRVHCKGPPQATSGCPEYGTIHSTRTQNNMQGQGTRAGVSHSDATSANVAKLGGWPGAVELDTDLMVPASVDRRTMIPGGKIGKVHESHAKNGRTGKTTYCGTTSSSSLLDEFDGVTNVPDTAKRSWKGGGGDLGSWLLGRVECCAGALLLACAGPSCDATGGTTSCCAMATTQNCGHQGSVWGQSGVGHHSICGRRFDIFCCSAIGVRITSSTGAALQPAGPRSAGRFAPC